MAEYLIQLTPNDNFFFGTGKEFGRDNQNYFVVSGYFPQQTSLLGMLRYQLLCKADEKIFKNNKIQDKTKASELIGKRSFTKGKKQKFGAIKSLSPVFLMKGESKVFPLNREYQDNKDDKKDKKDKKKKPNWQMREISADFSLLDNYEAKKGLPQLWSDGKNIYTIEDIFEERTQIGIKKNYEGKSEENAFYQQTYRTLKDDFSFAFYADIDTELQEKSLVVLGGERKTFIMKVKKQEQDLSFDYQASKNAHKIVLLSDAYLENAESLCDFAITNTVDFRCLQAETNDKTKYYSIKQKNVTEENYIKEGNLYKSKKSELYARGSVFYFKNEDKMNEFADELKQSEFYTIGYNHFKTIIKK